MQFVDYRNVSRKLRKKPRKREISLIVTPLNREFNDSDFRKYVDCMYSDMLHPDKNVVRGYVAISDKTGLDAEVCRKIRSTLDTLGALKKLTGNRTQVITSQNEILKSWENRNIQEEPIQEEPIQEELIQEEPIQEEPIQEEPIQEELIQEELIQEELIQEELIQEELIQEEPIQEEPIQVQQFTDEEVLQLRKLLNNPIQNKYELPVEEKGTRKPKTFNLVPELSDWLEKESKDTWMSMSDIVNALIFAAMKL